MLPVRRGKSIAAFPQQGKHCGLAGMIRPEGWGGLICVRPDIRGNQKFKGTPQFLWYALITLPYYLPNP